MAPRNTPPAVVHAPERAAIADLKAHTRNYRGHPEDQVEHLVESIREHGFYRNVVVANDGTILAGHGVIQAAEKLGMAEVPVIRLPYGPDDPKALKILAGDNELARLADIDDRLLSEILREIREDDALLGTGYDDAMLASLIFVTRPRSEISSHGEAAQWVGLPDYVDPGQPFRVVVSLDSEADRTRFMELIGVEKPHKKLSNTSGTWSCWWPARPRDDSASLRFTDAEPTPE